MLTTAREADELITAVRFPVHGKGAAFNEVARRHGDFAMVAVAAVVSGRDIRLGVGGVAATPVVRSVGCNAKDTVEKLAGELEGYDDLHASAALRKDLMRNLAPLVIAEAEKCAA
jgi:2-furoyl-CoA dehydrogenase FAD binding subunit